MRVGEMRVGEMRLTHQRDLIHERIRQFMQAQIKCSWKNNEIIIESVCTETMFYDIVLEFQTVFTSQFITLYSKQSVATCSAVIAVSESSTDPPNETKNVTAS